MKYDATLEQLTRLAKIWKVQHNENISHINIFLDSVRGTKRSNGESSPDNCECWRANVKRLLTEQMTSRDADVQKLLIR